MEKKKGSKKGSRVKCVVKGSVRWARTVLAWGLRDSGLPQPVTGNYLSYKHPGARAGGVLWLGRGLLFGQGS